LRPLAKRSGFGATCLAGIAIATLRQELDDAADSGLSSTALTAELDDLSAQFEQAVHDGLTRAGESSTVTSYRDVEPDPSA